MDKRLSDTRLSGDQLKIFAAIAMFIDHAAYGWLHMYLTIHYMDILPQNYTRLNTLYETLRGFGRLAFPVFCFFLVEGFLRTRNTQKYATRLLVFAFISEVPFDLGLYRKAIYTDHQNVMFTLFLGLLMLILIKYIEEELATLTFTLKWICILCTIAGFADLSFILKTDYSYKGIVLMAVLYLFRSNKSIRLLSAAAFSSIQKYAPISFLFLYFYDPDKKRKLKYFFYLYYPLHLIFIYWIGSLLFQ